MRYVAKVKKFFIPAIDIVDFFTGKIRLTKESLPGDAGIFSAYEDKHLGVTWFLVHSELFDSVEVAHDSIPDLDVWFESCVPIGEEKDGEFTYPNVKLLPDSILTGSMTILDLIKTMSNPNPDKPLFTTEEKLEMTQSQINDHLNTLRSLRPAEYTHNCPDWDEMEIDEYDSEITACTCYDSKTEWNIFEQLFVGSKQPKKIGLNFTMKDIYPGSHKEPTGGVRTKGILDEILPEGKPSEKEDNADIFHRMMEATKDYPSAPRKGLILPPLSDKQLEELRKHLDIPPMDRESLEKQLRDTYNIYFAETPKGKAFSIADMDEFDRFPKFTREESISHISGEMRKANDCTLNIPFFPFQGKEKKDS